MGKKEFCDETDLQKKSDHYHDAGGHDRGSGIPELLYFFYWQVWWFMSFISITMSCGSINI